ncbi:MAG: aminoglycoside 6-adenylyltransferase [Halanaerobiales bacterium]
MRSDKEVFNQIMTFAKEDERIKAVYLNGSRTNKNSPKDIFQDFDVVYVVKDTKDFINDKSWIKYFGEILIKQEPEYNDRWMGREVDFSQRYAYLMLFKDGIRIDLSFQNIKRAKEAILEDKLAIKLLDKEDILPEIQEPTDKQYHVKKPSEAYFVTRCNDFWWCMQNVAKGLFRNEIPYVMDMYNNVIRRHLDNVVDWYIGINTDFNVSTGKMHKYFRRYLPENYYQRYIDTYSDGEIANIWEAVFNCCDLFSELAQIVSKELGYSYNNKEEINIKRYLKKVEALPHNAKEIF